MIGICQARTAVITVLLSTTIAHGKPKNNNQQETSRRKKATYKKLSKFPYFNYEVEYINHDNIYKPVDTNDIYSSYMEADGFPSNNLKNANPLNKTQKVEGVYVGETNLAKNTDKFSHWRFVTYYKKKYYKNRIQGLDTIVENCHDYKWNIGGWNEDVLYSVQLSTKIGTSMTLGSPDAGAQLGLTAEIAQAITNGKTFSTHKAIQGTLGYTMEHVPTRVHENHVGTTYIQVFNERTQQSGFIINPTVRYKSPIIPINTTTMLISAFKRIVNGYKETLATYPKYFKLTNQNSKFYAEIENKKKCAGYENVQNNIDEDVLIEDEHSLSDE